MAKKKQTKAIRVINSTLAGTTRRAGMSQKALGKLCRVNQATVCLIANQKVEASERTRKRISKALGLKETDW